MPDLKIAQIGLFSVSDGRCFHLHFDVVLGLWVIDDLLPLFLLSFFERLLELAAILKDLDLHLQRIVIKVHIVPLRNLMVLKKLTKTHLFVNIMLFPKIKLTD